MKIIQELFFNIKKGNRWGAVCVLNYRIAHFFARRYLYIIGCPIILFYHIFFRHIVGFDIHEKASIGFPFSPWHCFGIAVNPHTIIGSGVKMAHNTTIGTKEMSKAPQIGDNVIIGPSVVIIGDISIGNNVIIGAGSVVVKDIESNVVIAGNPSKIIKYL